MNYPFTSEQFIDVISQYNISVWPAQIFLYVLAVIVIMCIFISSKYSSKIISGGLAFFWLWMGIVYHWLFFTSINPAARIFAVAFIVQGLIFAYFGLFRNKLSFKFDRSVSSYFGLGLILLGVLIYPIMGYVVGHRFPNNPTFGLPCPTTMFTLGVLLLATGPLKRLIIVPFIWSIIGFMAAVSFGIKEDVLLLLSGIVALIVILFIKNKKKFV